jgi:hypothetical protein
MKTKILLTLAAVAAGSPLVCAGGPGTLTFPRQPAPEPTSAVPHVWVDENYHSPGWPTPEQKAAQRGPVYVYDQKQYGGGTALVSPEQAQGIIDRFKAAYPKLGSPRLLIYVNRELVDETAGMKLIRREEHIESSRTETNTSGSVKSVQENTYRSDGKAAPTLADQQTIRDVERLFGRPLRQAGASLVDQKIAASLITDKPIGEVIGSTDAVQSRKDREAIGKIADAVIEILISSKTVTTTTLSGPQTITIPDIQATAVRVSDSKILGQASSTDVMNRVPPSQLGNFSIPEITEATALALMEDMTPAQ